MGTPEFSVPVLTALVKEGYEVAMVVTQPDQPKGRSRQPQPSAVKAAALQYGLPVMTPKRVREPQIVEELRRLEADLFVVVAFGQILSKEVLALPKWGCLNVHASLLPKYRGAAPMQWAILDGERETGVTIMQMDEGLDTGAMLSKRSIALTGETTLAGLHDEMMAVGAELLIETIPALIAGRIKAEAQPAESPTPYAKMIHKQMGEIDWRQSAELIDRQVRAFYPWPSAYTYLNGQLLKISSVRLYEAWPEKKAADQKSETMLRAGQPGTVLAVGRDEIVVACGQGALGLRRVQLQGKKEMDTAAFLRGYLVEAGCQLGKES